MTVIRTIAELRAHLEGARGGRIGLVPTMGALHEGHLSLLRAARAENDTVVLSIFVNPTQFDDPDDLAAYPRTIERDLELAASAGVDVVFAPEPGEMYPAGYATSVSVRGVVAESLEGAHRGSGHFDGVATVVSKLLLAALPDVAYFGAKDAQQVAVVRRLVADLGIPVRIAECPTSRDDDGLARSSRNTRLSPEERRRALAIPRALAAAQDAAAAGELDTEVLIARATEVLTSRGAAPDDAVAPSRTVVPEPTLVLEYAAIVDPVTFDPAPVLDRPLLLAVAARVGTIRLIDNVLLTPGGR